LFPGDFLGLSVADIYAYSAETCWNASQIWNTGCLSWRPTNSSRPRPI
jgi:hypothetical protein